MWRCGTQVTTTSRTWACGSAAGASRTTPPPTVSAGWWRPCGCCRTASSAARPPDRVAAAIADLLEDAADRLADFAVGEPDQVAARLMSEAGRGQTLIPPLHVDSWDDSRIQGRMRFHRFHLGSNGAAHGGAISLVFDDLLGQLANVPGHPRARTASIRVNYRRIIPIERELLASAEVKRGTAANSPWSATCMMGRRCWPRPRGCSSNCARASTEPSAGPGCPSSAHQLVTAGRRSAAVSGAVSHGSNAEHLPAGGTGGLRRPKRTYM